MRNVNRQLNIKGVFILMALLVNVIIMKAAFLHNQKWYWWLMVTVPLLIVAITIRQSRIVIRKS